MTEPKLKTATVRLRRKKLHDRLLAEHWRHKAAIGFLDADLLALMDRCPHEKTHYESAEYMPCLKICDVCGAEVKR